MTDKKTTALARVETLPAMPIADYYGTLAEIERVASACAKSGFWKEIRDASQAVVKMLAGREMGVGPMAALSGIFIIDGKPVTSANIIAANVKRSGRYNFRPVERTDERCVLAWFDRGEKVGESAFSMEDAKRAGLTTKSNWTKWPRAMLFNRALTEGARVYCPEAMGGVVYTVEEIRPDLEVTETGEPVVDVTPEPRRAPDEPPQEVAPPTLISEPQRKRLWAIAMKRFEQVGVPDNERVDVLRAICKDFGIVSSKEIPRAMYDKIVEAVERWLPADAEGTDEAAPANPFGEEAR